MHIYMCAGYTTMQFVQLWCITMLSLCAYIIIMHVLAVLRYVHICCDGLQLISPFHHLTGNSHAD